MLISKHPRRPFYRVFDYFEFLSQGFHRPLLPDVRITL